jgi:ferrous iron transport protein B
METRIRIALVGQPNVGKSMLINAIGNTRLKVGNFSGVTVSKKTISLTYRHYQIEITDLPGSYALNNFSQEERVTKQFIEQNDYDVILNVVDSCNLERNLYLTTELLILNKKMLVVLNMDDEAQKEGIDIDAEQLEKLLGCRCIKTSASKKTGVEALLDAVVATFERDHNPSRLQFSDVIEEEISAITTLLGEKKYDNPEHHRDIAINLLKEERNTFRILHDEPIWTVLQPLLNQSYEHIALHYQTRDMADIFSDEVVAIARGLATEVVRDQAHPNLLNANSRLQQIPVVTQSFGAQKSGSAALTAKIDALLLHPLLGLPIFLVLMWGLFQLTFDVGSIPMDWIDVLFASLIDGVKTLLGDNALSSLLGDGIIAGVGAVMLFLPNIMILFLGIALLETTGYMSRVAFLLDGFFHRFGLHGKSFIPLVTGFGCSVPAYMAARTLRNDRDRLLTLFIIGFMSCGARLPVYVLFVGAFFAAEYAGTMLFVIFITGALLGIIAAKVLKMTVFKGDDEPFVMEMPRYRLPALKLLWHTVSTQAWMYLKKAGTFILLASMLIWFASNYPQNTEATARLEQQIATAPAESKQELERQLAAYQLENSYLGKIGKFSEPFFAPLGFDWRMSVAIETGLAAKEVVVTTLSILYGLGDTEDENSQTLLEKIRAQIPFASAVSFILFMMIYLPCLAASMVFMREAGGWRYLGYLFVFTTSFAWVLAFIGYRVALLF